jgi:hypothetical protein
MKTLQNIDKYGAAFFYIIFEKTNRLYPKQNFIEVSKCRALFFIFFPIIIGACALAIYFFIDSWVERLVSSLLVSIVGSSHTLYFSKEHTFLNSPDKKLAFKQNSDYFFLLPHWLSHSMSMIVVLACFLLTFIIYKLF